MIALVTGVSSGIGREVAQLLAQRGARVFGTVRDPGLSIAGVETVQMDVTNESEVAEGLRLVLQQAGRIDVLVNNAGYALGGALEETSIEEARQQFESNFFGVLRVTQAVLPGMRRQHFGRIVSISSTLGLVPGPYRGIYAATKHALEAYSETLDHEVRQFGVRAVLVEPGFTKTSLDQQTRLASASLDAYADQKRRVEDLIRREIDRGDDARDVAEVVHRAIISTSPRLRYPVGQAVFVSRLRRFLPAGMFDKGLRKQFQLDERVEAGKVAELARGGIVK